MVDFQIAGDQPMSDFQYKNTIEMICQIMKANFEAGRTPNEVLAIVSALKGEPQTAKHKITSQTKTEQNFLGSQDFKPGETGMTDYQFKTYQETLYQLVKAKVEVGASPEEILTAIERLKQ